MLNIKCLTLGAYGTNCYIVHSSDSTSCAVIDPGYDAPQILTALDKLGLTVDAVLLTHGHFDHVGAVELLVKTTGCKLWLHQSDWAQKKNPLTAYLYPIANCTFTDVQFCEHGQKISAGGLTFTVLATPGHTHGSVCYACEDALFCGDTLFAGSCGRTDLPGGDPALMEDSLAYLAALETNYTVYPGHGGSSTLKEERRYNPYLKG